MQIVEQMIGGLMLMRRVKSSVLLSANEMQPLLRRHGALVFPVMARVSEEGKLTRAILESDAAAKLRAALSDSSSDDFQDALLVIAHLCITGDYAFDFSGDSAKEKEVLNAEAVLSKESSEKRPEVEKLGGGDKKPRVDWDEVSANLKRATGETLGKYLASTINFSSSVQSDYLHRKGVYHGSPETLRREKIRRGLSYGGQRGGGRMKIDIAQVSRDCEEIVGLTLHEYVDRHQQAGHDAAWMHRDLCERGVYHHSYWAFLNWAKREGFVFEKGGVRRKKGAPSLQADAFSQPEKDSDAKKHSEKPQVSKGFAAFPCVLMNEEHWDALDRLIRLNEVTSARDFEEFARVCLGELKDSLESFQKRLYNASGYKIALHDLAERLLTWEITFLWETKPKNEKVCMREVMPPGKWKRVEYLEGRVPYGINQFCRFHEVFHEAYGKQMALEDFIGCKYFAVGFCKGHIPRSLPEIAEELELIHVKAGYEKGLVNASRLKAVAVSAQMMLRPRGEAVRLSAKKGRLRVQRKRKKTE